MSQVGFLQNDPMMQAFFRRTLQGGFGADLATGRAAPGPISQLSQNAFVQTAAGGHFGAALSMPTWDLTGQAGPLPGQLTINIGGQQLPTSQSDVWNPANLGIQNPLFTPSFQQG